MSKYNLEEVEEYEFIRFITDIGDVTKNQAESIWKALQEKRRTNNTWVIHKVIVED